MRHFRAFLRLVGRLILSALAIAILGSMLIANMPAVDWSQDEMDARWSSANLQAIRNHGAHYRSVTAVFLDWTSGILSGNLGTSRALQVPVAQAIQERTATSLGNTFGGLAIAWTLAISLAFLSTAASQRWIGGMANFFTHVGLSIPSAVIALAGVYWRWPPALCIACALTPRIFLSVSPVLQSAWANAATKHALAFGLDRWTVLRSFIWLPSRRTLLQQLAIGWPLAFGISIPVEVLCGSPGLGHLAWTSAQGRDVPMLLNLAILTMLVTQLLTELFGQRSTPRPEANQEAAHA